MCGLRDSAKRTLSLPVRIGKPKGLGGLIDDIINPTFAVPVGLIVYGAKNQVVEGGPSFMKGFKMPQLGFAGKIVDAVKNLLP